MKRFWPFLSLALISFGVAQDRLSQVPGVEENRKAREELAQKLSSPTPSYAWVDGGRYAFQREGSWWVVDAATGVEAKSESNPIPAASARRGGAMPGRGRQAARVTAEDGTIAEHKDGSVWIDGKVIHPPVVPGSRVKYGTASWVYGEELDQRDAMGWSPDSQRLWMYRFDESKVPDYHLALSQNAQQSRLMVEAYPKPGQPNPEVTLLVFDRKSGQLTEIKVRPSQFDEGVGHYVYGIRWSPDGQSLLYYRTDRRQKTLEFCRANPATGATTVLDREENPAAWVENQYPTIYFDELPDIDAAPEFKGKALWISERNGWSNYYLLDLVKGGVKPLTQHQFEVRGTVQVDLKTKTLFYNAANGDSPSKLQLNRIGLDGTGHRRLTDPALTHRCQVSPGGSWIIDTAESVSQPAAVRLLDAQGAVKKILKESASTAPFAETGFRQPEKFTFLAADGKTQLQGVLHFPRNFDPTRKYPMLVGVYGGPLGPMSSSFSDRFRQPNRENDYGFLEAEFENRGQGGRGRKFKNALYQNMGIIEIDDQAAGVKELFKRGYVDPARVGIHGTSYGGYASLMALFRHPDVFRAASSSSCVGQWTNYDTTYTERYMGLLPESKEAYDRSSTLTYAKDAKGWLMIYYGTADDNTHPSNSLQVMSALQRAGKSFEVQVGVDAGHSGLNMNRMLEFFIERMDIQTLKKP